MHRTHRPVAALVGALATVALLAGCGSDDEADAVAAQGSAGARGATSREADVTIAVTTTILGDVVAGLVGDLGEVVTIMPRGANPHDFQASAREAAQLADADVIVTNGGGFEEGLLTVVEGAASDGVPVLEALELLDEDALAAGDEHGHEGEDEHAHAEDAHFFTDPLAVAAVVDVLADELPEQVPGLDAAQLREQADALVGDLGDLHAEIEATLDAVPADRRVLVTDHDVLQSFADRYGFEVVATVIPSGSTSDGVSGGALAELAEALRTTGVSAVFTEETASSELADTLASEVGEVAVVSLYAESLGPEGSEAGTYAAMMRVNAGRIAEALGD